MRLALDKAKEESSHRLIAACECVYGLLALPEALGAEIRLDLGREDRAERFAQVYRPAIDTRSSRGDPGFEMAGLGSVSGP